MVVPVTQIQNPELQQALVQADHERRIKELEQDMKTIKPIVYETSNSVKQIEKSVEKMEQNSDKIKGYILVAVITGVIGMVFVALQNSILEDEIMKINWKVRVKNPYFYAALFLAIVAPVGTYFGVNANDVTSWAMVYELTKQAVLNPYIVVTVIISVATF